MLFRAKLSQFSGRAHRKPCGNRNTDMRPRLESLERRMVLSTVSGVSAEDAAAAGEATADDPLTLVAHAQSTSGPGENLLGSEQCAAVEASFLEWIQVIKEETPEEKVERLEKELGELEKKLGQKEARLEELKKQHKTVGKKWEEADKAVDELEDDPHATPEQIREKKDLRARLDRILRRNEAEQDKVKEEISEIKDAIKRIKDELERLKSGLKDDQDGDALPDNPPADDTADLRSLNPGSVLNLCLSPSGWHAIAAVHSGDGGTGHVDIFLSPTEWDKIAAALASQGTADSGPSQDFLSSLGTVPELIDVVRVWDLSTFDNPGAIDFVRFGAVDVPETELRDFELDDVESFVPSD